MKLEITKLPDGTFTIIVTTDDPNAITPTETFATRESAEGRVTEWFDSLDA